MTGGNRARLARERQRRGPRGLSSRRPGPLGVDHASRGDTCASCFARGKEGRTRQGVSQRPERHTKNRNGDVALAWRAGKTMLTSRADGAWNDDEINNMFVFDNDTRAIRGSTVSTEGLIPPGRRADHLGPPPRRPLGLFADDDIFFFLLFRLRSPRWQTPRSSPAK